MARLRRGCAILKPAAPPEFRPSLPSPVLPLWKGQQSANDAITALLILTHFARVGHGARLRLLPLPLLDGPTPAPRYIGIVPVTLICAALFTLHMARVMYIGAEATALNCSPCIMYTRNIDPFSTFPRRPSRPLNPQLSLAPAL